MMRHFQHWKGPTAGPTYNRANVEILVTPTSPGDAVAEQNRMICQLSPRDNTIKTECPDGDPF